MITLDAAGRRLTLEVSDVELAERQRCLAAAARRR